MLQHKYCLLLALFAFQLVTSQVKIGSNPNIIDSGSLVELESTNKALVLSRLTNAQMLGLTPLRGAVVYNIDTQCIYFYDSTQWLNLCNATTTTGFSYTDNGDGTITLMDGLGGNTTFDSTPETLTTLLDNSDGTFTYTNENGVATVITTASTNSQNISTDGTSGNISIDDGSTLSLNVDDADANTTNEIQDLQFSSNIITLSLDPDATSIDLSGFDDSVSIAAVQADVDLNESDADTAISAVQTDVDLNESDADAAIALKENSTNKSSDVTLADGTNTLFPTELAVKTYVDNQVGTITTDDDISAVDFDGTNLNVTESGTTLSADISALNDTAAIAAVQADVDLNESDADTAISAVQTDVDLNESDADAAISAVQADVDLNESDADAAIALKENSTNKSSDITLADGTNTLFPTELAVKTYVDTQVGTITTDDDISAVTFDGTNLNVTESGTTLSADISALNDTAAIAAVQADVDLNESDADTAISVVQTDVDLNESDADTAIALKENITNKSSDITLADGTNTLFPTELAVKTYVDTQVGTITTDDDISAVTFDGTNLNVTESGTTLSANISALNDTAAIAAVQSDVDQNESDTDAAISVVQTDVDLNESDSDAAILLKENSSNKSSDITLADGTNTLFPTELAVKTYVDTQVGTITTDDDISAVEFDGTNLNVTESGTTLSADISALNDTAAIAAVQADVDLNESDADAAIAAVQADIDLNESDADAAISALQADVDLNESDADAAISALQADVDLNESDADAAIALKENTSNKSSDITLADGTNTLFPTELAVKTYVDNQVGTITTDDDISAVTFDGTNLNVTESGTTLSADISALNDTAAIAVVQADVDLNESNADTAISAVQADVDLNESDADAAISALQADVDLNESDADAAIALKENSTNKSSDITLADGTNTLFPTELAVKTYVDTQVGTITTDDDISAVDFDGTNLNVTESGTTLSADISALNDTAAIAVVQADVDLNESDADAAISAIQADVDLNESDADTAISAVQADVDLNESDADTAISAVQADVNLNESDADTAISAVQADVDLNESDADAAIALKENTSNKSSDITLADGTNTLFPTELAVKTYVDNQVGTITTDDDISAVDFDGTNLNVTESGTTLSADISALNDTAAIAAVQSDVDLNESDADAAISAVQTDVDLNESDADTAIALKENSTNKSSDVTLADGTNTLFPTELAVKTYVDTQVGTITTDDDISAVDFDGTNLNVTESGTTLSADISALNDTAAIAVVQADVDLNESDADTAISAVQADVDLNESDADAAISAVQADIDLNESDADTAISAVQADVDLNESDADAAIALKENSTNKSSDVTLADGTNTLFPTELAVKTYVDTQVGTITTDDDISAVDFDGTNLNVTESGTTLSADISALNDTAAIAAVQADVDLNESDADTAISALQADVNLNESDADAAISAVQADVDLNEGDADAAIALKEDTSNKSSDVTLADGTNTLFPTELAVKTYVDNQISTIPTYTAGTGLTLSGTAFSVNNLAGDVTGTTNATVIADGAISGGAGGKITDETITADDLAPDSVTASEINADAVGTSELSLNAVETENILNANVTTQKIAPGSTNQILVTNASGIVAWENQATNTVTSLAQNTTTGLITYTNEANTAQTANTVGVETTNQIEVAANGGAFYESPIKAFGKIDSGGGVVKATTGITSTRISNGRYRVTLPTGVVSDANYIIQLTQPGRGGAGNDDPGISYSNQTATTFEVIIGDNDNGGTDRSRFNSEFMFTILDL